MKKLLSAALAATLISFSSADALACTNMLVGKKASVNGATMISYNADSHTLYGELYFTPAADHAPGAMRKVIEWDTNKPLGEIPQPAHTYRWVMSTNGRSPLPNLHGAAVIAFQTRMVSSTMVRSSISLSNEARQRVRQST